MPIFLVKRARARAKARARARARARACLSQEGVPVFTVGTPGCPYLRGVYIFMTPGVIKPALGLLCLQ